MEARLGRRGIGTWEGFVRSWDGCVKRGLWRRATRARSEFAEIFDSESMAVGLRPAVCKYRSPSLRRALARTCIGNGFGSEFRMCF